MQHSQLVVIVNAMPELAELDCGNLGSRTVVDCWPCLSPQQIAQLSDYRPLGQGMGSNGRSLLNKIGRERLHLLTD
jgi:hypothetical protein